jgi:glycosyltransferase involved in cell wall biosynthesis
MVITDTDRRGAQVFAHDLHGSLAHTQRVDTVALTDGATGGLDVPVLGRTRRGADTLRALRQRALDADVVVAHGSTTLPMCALACAGTGTPFVYRQISDSLFWASDRLRLVRTRLLLGRAAHVVTLWTGAAEVLRTHFGLPADRITIVPNGVPGERFPPVTAADRADARRRLGVPDGRVVAYVGALVEEKGVDSLIDALAASPRCDDTHLLIAGDGPARSTLERQVAQQLAGRATFTGSLPDPWPAYAAADVVAFPSRGGDSMPAAVIETAFAGVPLVATHVAAIPEMVVDGESALLVSPDDRAGLRAALDRVLDDPHLATRLADANRSHALAHYEIDVVAAQWLDVLARVTLA